MVLVELVSLGFSLGVQAAYRIYMVAGAVKQNVEFVSRLLTLEFGDFTFWSVSDARPNRYKDCEPSSSGVWATCTCLPVWG